MAADLGRPPPDGSKDPKDYLPSKILHFFDVKMAYELQAKIAAGNFGKVFKAVHHGAHKNAGRSGVGATGRDTPIAVKLMELDKVEAIFKDKFVARELDALKTVNHENAVKIYDIINTGTPTNRTFIFMEFAPNGNILDYCKKVKKGPLDEPLAGYWMNQIFSAMEALHDIYKIAHRDIKPDNVMLGTRFEAKVADFGFATPIKTDPASGQMIRSRTFCGTPAYEAPQILNRRSYDPTKADVWATGVMMYYMLVFTIPFSPRTMINDIQAAAHKQKPGYQKLPADCKALLDMMLQVSEETRQPIRVCRQAPWARRLTARPASLG